MTTAECLAWLGRTLKREITVSEVIVGNERKFLVDYVNHEAPATKLAGATEDEAIVNLFNYLNSQKSLDTADETKA